MNLCGDAAFVVAAPIGKVMASCGGIMSERFVVEADRRIIGVAVRGPGGFRFFSSDAAYLPLEGRTFARAKALANAVTKMARTRRTQRRASRFVLSTQQ
jgi:hypothetical protein